MNKLRFVFSSLGQLKCILKAQVLRNLSELTGQMVGIKELYQVEMQIFSR